MTLLKAYGALRDGRNPEHVRPWLYRIAHNASLDILGRRRELPSPDLPERAAPAHGPSPGALVEAVAALPETQRKVYVLRELHGLRIDETARELALSRAQVEQALFAARNRMAEHLVFGERLNCVAVRRLAAGPLDADERRALRTHLRSCLDCRRSLGATGRAYGAFPVDALGWLRALPGLLAGGGAPAAVKVGAVVATATLAAGTPIGYEIAREQNPPRAAAPAVTELRSRPAPHRVAATRRVAKPAACPVRRADGRTRCGAAHRAGARAPPRVGVTRARLGSHTREREPRAGAAARAGLARAEGDRVTARRGRLTARARRRAGDPHERTAAGHRDGAPTGAIAAAGVDFRSRRRRSDHHRLGPGRRHVGRQHGHVRERRLGWKRPRRRLERRLEPRGRLGRRRPRRRHGRAARVGSRNGDHDHRPARRCDDRARVLVRGRRRSRRLRADGQLDALRGRARARRGRAVRQAPFFRACSSSAMISSAISAGVSPPRSSPIGPRTESATSPRCSRRFSCARREPSPPT